MSKVKLRARAVFCYDANMPNKQHLRLWVDDLLNGGHSQTYGVLCRKNKSGFSFCCLGRLSEVAMANGIEIERRNNHDNNDTFGYCASDSPQGNKVYSDTGWVQNHVAKWVDLNKGDLAYFANMNDSGKSFAEIAHRIIQSFDLSSE